MLESKELDSVIKKPLQRILDELNNHITREQYVKLEKTLKEVYKLIESVITTKESKNND